MRIFLTGCTGFLGESLLRNLAENCNNEDLSLHVLCRDPKNLDLEISFLLKKLNAKIIVGDLDKITFPKFPLDIIFHAAAHKHVNLMEDQPDEALRNNFFASIRLMELACELSVDRFIFISTDKAIKHIN